MDTSLKEKELKKVVDRNPNTILQLIAPRHIYSHSAYIWCLLTLTLDRFQMVDFVTIVGSSCEFCVSIQNRTFPNECRQPLQSPRYLPEWLQSNVIWCWNSHIQQTGATADHVCTESSARQNVVDLFRFLRPHARNGVVLSKSALFSSKWKKWIFVGHSALTDRF